jgi:ribonuclease HII
MRAWDEVFPQYGLKNHKGYSTDEHWKALEKHGPTALHRFSFWPVREHCPHTFWTGYPRQQELFPAEDPAAGTSEQGESGLVREMAACNR